MKKRIAMNTETLSQQLSEVHLSYVPPERYEGHVVSLSDNFYEQARQKWVEVTGTVDNIPPLPNERITFPKGIKKSQRCAGRYKSKATESDSKRPRWIEMSVPSEHRVTYKGAYGTKSTLSLVRKQLIDLELETDLEYYACYLTGLVVKHPRELDADHACTWKTIKENIWKLSKAMTTYPEFGEFIVTELEKHDETKFFFNVEVDDESGQKVFTPTHWIYRAYINDVSNIYLAKKADNEDLSGNDFSDFLKSQDGKKLYLMNEEEANGLDRRGIIVRSADGRGLGEMIRHKFFAQNRNIVDLFNSSLSISDNLNEKVKNILELRQTRLSEGRTVSGRIRAESGRTVAMVSASEIDLSSDTSGDSDEGASLVIATLTKSLGTLLARSGKIASNIVKELQADNEFQIQDKPEFIREFQELIKRHFKKGATK